MKALNDVLAQNLTVVLAAVAVVAVVALLMGAVALSRLRLVTRRFAWVTGDGAGSPDTLSALLRTVEANAADVGKIKATVDRMIEDGRRHFKHVGLVRYDAFEGVAGQQSYSLCLLDDNRNGILLSSLVGREFTRSYAVEIKDGQASRKLGDEEASALGTALSAAP